MICMALFSKKKLSINLEKNEYSPGETIKGIVELELEKPLKADILEVALIGAVIKTETRHSQHHFDDQDYMFDDDEPFETASPFFFSKKILDSEKEYTNFKYEFELKIPENVHDEEPSFDGTLGKLMNFSRKLGGHPPRIEWYVKAQLEIPRKIDLRASSTIILN